jgi:hypothetical protein
LFILFSLSPALSLSLFSLTGYHLSLFSLSPATVSLLLLLLLLLLLSLTGHRPYIPTCMISYRFVLVDFLGLMV